MIYSPLIGQSMTRGEVGGARLVTKGDVLYSQALAHEGRGEDNNVHIAKLMKKGEDKWLV